MKKVIIGALLLLILAGVSIYITRQNNTSTLKSELTDFGVEDTERITRIVLKDENGQRVDLSKVNGEWLLNDEFKARPDAVKILLTTINKLSVKAPIGQKMMNSVLKNIISKHTLVEIYDGGELIKNYYVGGPDRDHTGTYMLMKGSSRPFIMHMEGFHGFLSTRYFTNPNEWKHRGIFEYNPEEIKHLAVSYPDQPEKNFSIDQPTTGSFEVFYGSKNNPVEQLDTFMLSAYLANYKMIHFEGFEETKPQSFVDSVLRSTPIFRIELTDIEGKTTLVEGFRKPIKDGYNHEGDEIDFDFDRLYLKVNKNQVLVGQYAIFDKLTKRIAFLTNR
ncbi:MAG: hypothetical protein WEC59_03345 [Salibacteraceae bacterium]